MTRKPTWRRLRTLGLARDDMGPSLWLCSYDLGGHDVGCMGLARFWRGAKSFAGICLTCARRRGLKVAEKVKK